MGWRVEATRELTATPASVWRLYAEPRTWPEWAHDVAAADLRRPLELGSVGRITTAGDRARDTRIVELRPGRSLAREVRLPGAVLSCRYEIEVTHDGCRVRHEIGVDGPLAWLYRLTMRDGRAAGLTEETARVEALAASSTR